MKEYKLLIITDGTIEKTVVAESMTSGSGMYQFYDNNHLIASYPIDRTVIESIRYDIEPDAW